MNKKSIKTKAKAFKLPTLAAFKRLSFKRKAEVFRDWAKTMKGSYNSLSCESCALSQFGLAMTGSSSNDGSSYGFRDKAGHFVEVLRPRGARDNWSVIHPDEPGVYIGTFSSLVKRLNTYIKKHYGA